ncbi:DegV family protein [Anaerotignum lactatifermentans]|uniref:DegV family protein n=1 Tax=Anaerotignum lactatifermentans TaxID=160404 RepID=A0ABS2GCC0_9FIRM|nr:DegV family protein [Anaerotignum lactatifermentans]MBM6829930.1 DegV family protein [Anaerotignum lactatifermentans]MBM6878433.1 DegV family protein [Anaerotignum lactatifermentans]MBM6951645.1 DegV family protein [Anaerotignum lactatifermentans]
MTFQVISDSACDIDPRVEQEKGILLVPYYVSFVPEVYQKERTEMPVPAFYRQMAEHPGVFPKTSMPTVEDYADVFRPASEKGLPVLCICLSAKFSGSYQSACLAREEVLEEFPDAQILVMDSACATAEQGLLVEQAAQMAAADVPFLEAAALLEQVKQTGRILFTTANLDYLQKGGRIGKVMKMAAVALKIKPLMEMKAGELFPVGMSRSRKKSLSAILAELEKAFGGRKEEINLYRFAVGFGYGKEEAAAFYEEVEEKLRQMGYTGDLPLYQIGATIGVHTGPYPIGFGYMRRWETMKEE